MGQGAGRKGYSGRVRSVCEQSGTPMGIVGHRAETPQSPLLGTMPGGSPTLDLPPRSKSETKPQ